MISDNEFECFHCKGTGKGGQAIKYGSVLELPEHPCATCNGTGKVDWIQNIVKRKEYHGISGWAGSYDFASLYPSIINTGALS